MAASLALEDYLDALSMATARIHEEAQEAGLDASVPTCPGWSVLQLVAHQGMIHRWATAHVLGQGDVDADAVEAEGMHHANPGAWLMAGSERLEAVLRASRADLDVWFFLKDAGPPRDAWARRQAHETSIHAVDALSAKLQAFPHASDVDIDPDFASDGIDELLCGFLTRKDESLRTSRPVTVLVHTDDTERDWTLRLSSEPVVATPGRPDTAPDTTWSGDATQLYLGLWNRAHEIRQEGIDALAIWRRRMTVTWS